jgi:signal transduction histidine kinase
MLSTPQGPLDRPWVRAAAEVVALELVVVGGTALLSPGGAPPDPIAYGLLALSAAGPGLSRWSRLGGLAMTLAAVLAYVARGPHGPVFLVVVALAAALFGAVRPERPRRTVAIGAVTLLGVHLAGVDSPVAGTLLMSLVHQVGWISAPLVLGHAMAASRANRAAAEERARLAEQTREEHAQRRVAEERLRIARELHDVVSHSISVINVQAGAALHVIEQQPDQARQALLTIRATSKETLHELRGVLGLLRQGEEAEPRDPAPTLDQLDSLVQATTRAGVPTQLAVAGDARRLSPAVELTAYRIVQESLTNVLRHADAASAAVTLTYANDRVAIEVADDGRGANGSGRTDQTGGFGIVGMHERAAEGGGRFEAGPRHGGGFVVNAWLPAADATA